VRREPAAKFGPGGTMGGASGSLRSTGCKSGIPSLLPGVRDVFEAEDLGFKERVDLA
jgi:hypothetical protein